MLITLLVLLLWASAAEAQSTLGNAAAAMSPGTWLNFTSQMGNINATASVPAWDSAAAAPGPAYDGSQPAWNSGTRQIYIQTAEHGRAGGTSPFCDTNYWLCSWPNYPTAAWKSIWTYDDTTNNWTVPALNASGQFPSLSGFGVAGVHVFGAIAYDDGNKVLYVKENENASILRLFRYCASNSPA